MFSLMNTRGDEGKNSAWMCKILDFLSEFFRGIRQPLGRLFYLLEGQRLRDGLLLWVGLRIAFLPHMRAFARIRSGRG
jgi:hypothetical protein